MTIDGSGDTPTLRFQTRLKQWGGETTIEGPNGEPAITSPHFDRALVAGLTRAMNWRGQLESGKARSLEAIAQQERCTEAYVRQLLGLAFLAPDIVERVLSGSLPRHITIDRLVRMDLALSWREQRRQLGLDS